MYNAQVQVDREAALWGGRFTDPANDRALELSSSLDVDLPLAKYDVDGTRAHLEELTALGLLPDRDRGRLDKALTDVANRLEAGTFRWRPEHEDIHMNIEAAVIDAVGPELGGHLQAGRSRNEEIVSDERRWLQDAAQRLDVGLKGLQQALLDRAQDEADTVLPAHTHTQPAQPVLLAHHLLAYFEMLDRDRARLTDAAARANVSPAGSGAAVGSGLAIDRHRLARRLGFAAVSDNSLDSIADRDYAVELVAAVALAMTHLSRIGGELVLWSTPYVGFVRLADAYASGSSMLPNKRNPDSAELIRARAARVSADLATLLSLTSGLPLAYHRDLQETRRAMFDAVASLELCTEVLTGIVRTLTFNRDAMRVAAQRGHALATALAERLVRAGVPFRSAHQRVGRLVGLAEERGCDLAGLPEAELRSALPELADYETVMPTVEEALAGADVHGGTAPDRVTAALADARQRLAVGA
jgi:argininosuccinate lyase